MGALWNQKLETVAQELAAGRSPEEASATAGYDRKASSFKANARKRAQRKDVKERVKELRAPGIARAEAQVGDWNEYICSRLYRIADVDVPDIKTSDQIAAMRLLVEKKGLKAPDQHQIARKNGGKIVIEWAPSSE